MATRVDPERRVVACLRRVGGSRNAIRYYRNGHPRSWAIEVATERKRLAIMRAWAVARRKDRRR